MKTVATAPIQARLLVLSDLLQDIRKELTTARHTLPKKYDARELAGEVPFSLACFLHGDLSYLISACAELGAEMREAGEHDEAASRRDWEAVQSLERRDAAYTTAYELAAALVQQDVPVADLRQSVARLQRQVEGLEDEPPEDEPPPDPRPRRAASVASGWEEFYHAITKWRSDRGLTLSRFASGFGVSGSFLSTTIRGVGEKQTRGQRELLKKLIRHTGIEAPSASSGGTRRDPGPGGAEF